MNDDFRISFRVDGDGVVGELLEGLRAGEVGREAADRLGDRVVVSHDDDLLFLYTGTEDDARTAAAAVRPGLLDHGLRIVEERIERWHPDGGYWARVDRPLPSSDEERAEEHRVLMSSEANDSRRAGVPEWEVRVTLPDGDAARRYAEQLQSEDLYVIRRSHHVLAGANTEDEAEALAERLRASAPPDARFEVEANGQVIWPTLNPFAIFGGLGT